jgi:hypothetical protein
LSLSDVTWKIKLIMIPLRPHLLSFNNMNTIPLHAVRKDWYEYIWNNIITLMLKRLHFRFNNESTMNKFLVNNLS